MKYNVIVIVNTVALVFSLKIEEMKETQVSTNKSIINYEDTTTDKLMASETENPCKEIPQFDMPDFRQPGRRISEIKCLEYKWNTETIEELIKQDEKCQIYQRDFNNRTLERVKREPLFAGGHLTKPGDLPHMGAIGWTASYGGWIFKCGGTLISNKHVVTAAHCSKASSRDRRLANPIPQIVRLGTRNIIRTDDGYQRDLKIFKIIKHPRYSSPKRYFDIALIELETKIYFDTHIHPACLWYDTDTQSLGRRAAACGWGVTGEGRRDTTNELREGSLDIISNDVCNELLLPLCNRLWCGLQEHQMCAGVLRGGIDVCQGDSGGSLHVEIPLKAKHKLYYLVGITSFGFGCARPNTPSVYARVSGFVDWIENIVWEKEIKNITGINVNQTLH